MSKIGFQNVDTLSEFFAILFTTFKADNYITVSCQDVAILSLVVGFDVTLMKTVNLWLNKCSVYVICSILAGFENLCKNTFLRNRGIGPTFLSTFMHMERIDFRSAGHDGG